MPLPKPPNKPATLLDLTTVVQARATRTRPRPADADASPADAPALPASVPVAAAVPPPAPARVNTAPRAAGPQTAALLSPVARRAAPPEAAAPAAPTPVSAPAAPSPARRAASSPVTGAPAATAATAGQPAAAGKAPTPSPTTASMTGATAPGARETDAMAGGGTRERSSRRGRGGRGAAAAPAAVVPAAASPAVAAAPAAIAPQAPATVVPQAPAVTAALPLAATPADSRPRPRGGKRAAAPQERPRLFVLDTNVLMHDPSSLFRFAEHDVFLPMMTLEELDNHKKGMSEVSRNARAVSRTLDQLVALSDGAIDAGIALSALGNRDAGGKLKFQTEALEAALPSSLPAGKADNQILGVVRALKERLPDQDVVLVSKDINMRVKARALGLAAEDYYNDQVLEDTDLLYSGMLALPPDFWDKHGKGIESWQQGGYTFYRISGPLVGSFMMNQFVYLDGEMPLVAQVKELNGRTAVLQTLRDYGHHKNAVWGITARNREQNFAFNLLMNPEIDFVSLLGQAGTGKTLLTLAAGLTQTIEAKRFSEIIVTRATVPVGEDIGYLPGTEEEKMQPWMGAFEDNLEVLNQGDPAAGEWGRQATNDLIRSRVKIKSMSFMRGRTFINKFLIIDEAQNLTPKQMKTLVTRAGPGTKVVCLGNIAQIDTPYLTEGSSGLTYVVDRFKGWGHSGHVTLQRGERSRLADFAADAL